MLSYRYREQAAQDADWVLRRVQEHSQQLGPRKVISSLESSVKTFCKNAHALRVIKGKSIAEEYKGSINLSEIGNFYLKLLYLCMIVGGSLTFSMDFMSSLTWDVMWLSWVVSGAHLENPESELVWYVMLRAVDQFQSEFRAYPGYFQDQVETDIVRLKVCVRVCMFTTVAANL